MMCKKNRLKMDYIFSECLGRMRVIFLQKKKINYF